MSDFIDAQDKFNHIMCQAQAIIGSLYDNCRYEDMDSDHVGALLFLADDNLKKLDASYKSTLTAVKGGY
jgi:hypothetical protein